MGLFRFSSLTILDNKRFSIIRNLSFLKCESRCGYPLEKQAWDSVCVNFWAILHLGQIQSNLVNSRTKNRSFQFSEMITFSYTQYRVQHGVEVWWWFKTMDILLILISSHEISRDLGLPFKAHYLYSMCVEFHTIPRGLVFGQIFKVQITRKCLVCPTWDITIIFGDLWHTSLEDSLTKLTKNLGTSCEEAFV